MFKEIVDDARRTPDIGRSQKLTMSTLCSGELKKEAQLGQNILMVTCCIGFPLRQLTACLNLKNTSFTMTGI